MKFLRQVNVLRLILLALVFLGLGAWVLHKRMSNREPRMHFSVQDRLQQYEPLPGRA